MDKQTRVSERQRRIWMVRRVLALVFLALIVAVIVLAVKSCGGKKQEDAAPKIGYAEGVVATDADELQKAVDELAKRSDEPGIALEYQNEATSTDGVNFDCYIANSAQNEHDMYIDVYADDRLTDEIFLSELLRPGTAFEHIKLNKALDKGSHTVYVAFTQVGDVDGEQTILGQVMVTMDFTVS